MPVSGPFTPGQQRPVEVLRARAVERFTGRVDLTSTTGDVAHLWFVAGALTAAAVPGPRPRLGVRLLSAGLVRPEDLDAALRRQAADPAALPVGELLVAASAVEADEVENVARIQMIDQVSDVLGWDIIGTANIGDDPAPVALRSPFDIDEVLLAAQARRDVWEAMVNRLGGPRGIPRPSMLAAPRANLLLGPYDWAVLTKVDGLRSVEKLADHSGLSLYETAQILTGLADVGLVVLPEAPRTVPSAHPHVSASQPPAARTEPGPRRASVDAASLLRELSALNRDPRP